MTEKELHERLKEPFEKHEIEWRAQQVGVSKGGKCWAMVLAYVQARAIQNRLDDIFGVMGWQVSYRTTEKGVICNLSVWRFLEGLHISKEDGAGYSDVEPFKGGISGALKRVAASGYGIGRYLYYLEDNFAKQVSDTKEGPDWIQAKAKNPDGSLRVFYWKPPELPDWALPSRSKK